ncbi:helix-turn-helix transcriptional regulator [Sediminibacillus albus]|uniref:AraC-type DNA-binding protein n=1 Tax=Sediminibacillus albus TaxID=407036 RepID=A0A1G8VI92_9BACI|nr:AraC family transcriptional regulator [Sediminibacillus albus]SDJ65782.1 AraC-type DNA-binding protein [Sediminibacillus albus]
MIYDNENGLILLRSDKLGERDWRSDQTYKLIFSPFGMGKYQTRKGDLSIDHRQFFIFNPFDEHRQLEIMKEKFLVELEPLLMEEAAEQLGYHSIDIEFASVTYYHRQVFQWASFIREFVHLHEQEPAAVNELFFDNSLTQLAILMLRYGAGAHQCAFPAAPIDSVLKPVVDALKEGYQENWTLSEMAAVARINKYQFSHLFKEGTGVSPYSWLQLYRLMRSQPALIHTEQSILHIALAHGFKNVSSYNHLFKKVYGKTPTEFRLARRIHN